MTNMATVYANIIRKNRPLVTNLQSGTDALIGGQFGFAYTDKALVIRDITGAFHSIYTTDETIKQTKDSISIKDPVATEGSLPISAVEGDLAYVQDQDAYYVYTGSTWSQMGGEGTNLNDLGDIVITSPSVGDNLIWNGTVWTNVTPTLDGLSDVTLTGLTDGDILQYDSVSGKWKNTSLSTATNSMGNEPDSFSVGRFNVTQFNRLMLDDGTLEWYGPDINTTFSEEYLPGSNWDNTDKKYVAPADGRYFFSAYGTIVDLTGSEPETAVEIGIIHQRASLLHYRHGVIVNPDKADNERTLWSTSLVLDLKEGDKVFIASHNETNLWSTWRFSGFKLAGANTGQADNFVGSRTMYVSQRGNDVNNGFSRFAPKATIGACTEYINSISTTAFSDSTRWAIVCEDSSSFLGGFTVYPYIHLEAPKATVIGSIGQSCQSSVNLFKIDHGMSDAFVYEADSSILHGQIHTKVSETYGTGRIVHHSDTNNNDVDWFFEADKVWQYDTVFAAMFHVNTKGKLIVDVKKIYSDEIDAIAFHMESDSTIIHHGGEVVLTGAGSKLIVNEGTTANSKFTGDGSRVYAAHIVDQNTSLAITSLSYAECLAQSGNAFIITYDGSGGEVNVNCGVINEYSDGCFAIPETGSTTKIHISDSSKRTVSDDDYIPKSLNDSLVAGANITLTKNNYGAFGEKIVISSTAGSGSGGTLQDAYDSGRNILLATDSPITIQENVAGNALITGYNAGYVVGTDGWSLRVKNDSIALKSLAADKVTALTEINSVVSATTANQTLVRAGLGGITHTTTSGATQTIIERNSGKAITLLTDDDDAKVDVNNPAYSTRGRIEALATGESFVNVQSNNLANYECEMLADETNEYARFFLDTPFGRTQATINDLMNNFIMDYDGANRIQLLYNDDADVTRIVLSPDETVGQEHRAIIELSGTHDTADQSTALKFTREGETEVELITDSTETSLSLKRGSATLKIDPAVGIDMGGYVFPYGSDGFAGQALVTDGFGNLTWSEAGGGAGTQGPQGAVGATGPQGAASTVPGPMGPQGAQGVQGAQGNDAEMIGPQGPQGVQGPMGLTGPKGDDGADSTVAGPQGPQGANGSAGVTGATGPQGAQGAQGAQGDAGIDGFSNIEIVPSLPASPVSNILYIITNP